MQWFLDTVFWENDPSVKDVGCWHVWDMKECFCWWDQNCLCCDGGGRDEEASTKTGSFHEEWSALAKTRIDSKLRKSKNCKAAAVSRVASADIMVGDETGVETCDKIRGCCKARSWGCSDFNGTLFQDNRPQNLIVVSKGLQGKERPIRQLE